MSTHAYIGFENPDATVSFIYCHFDGYISGVGKELLTNYNTPEDALALVESGDQSSVGEPYRDRPGENWEDIKPALDANRDDFFKDLFPEYVYLFRDDTKSWTVQMPGGNISIGLRRAVEKNL